MKNKEHCRLPAVITINKEYRKEDERKGERIKAGKDCQMTALVLPPSLCNNFSIM